MTMTTKYYACSRCGGTGEYLGRWSVSRCWGCGGRGIGRCDAPDHRRCVARGRHLTREELAERADAMEDACEYAEEEQRADDGSLRTGSRLADAIVSGADTDAMREQATYLRHASDSK